MIKRGNYGKEGRNLKKIWTTNLGLKILAIVFAVLLWLIVVNIDDPVMVQPFYGIQVEILHPEAITDTGKIYEILDNTNIISVVVTARRSILSELRKEDLKAVADMEELTFMDTLGISVSSEKYNDKIESIKPSTENLRVKIDNIKKTQLVIQVNTTGKPEVGYLIGNVTTDQTVVRLSGPESIIKQVARAVANVDVSGMTTDISTSIEIKLYDNEDNLITNSVISKNIDSVSVSVDILGTKTVPLEYDVMGTPVDGYELTGVISSSPSEVTLGGKKSILESIEKIEVPETALNVTGQSGDVTVIVDLGRYIPDNLFLVNNKFNGKANVIVYIEKKVTKIVSLQKEKLKFTNIPDGFTVESVDFDETKLFNISGLQKVIETINPDNIAGTIDIAAYMEENEIVKLSEGTYDVEAILNLPEGARVDIPYMVRMKVTLEE